MFSGIFGKCLTIGSAMAAVLVVAPALEASASEPLKHADFDRVVVITTLEPKVTRSADKTAYPDTAERYAELFAMGGYRMEPPDENNEWYARAYQWHPATVVVNKGDRVLLEFFGINGDNHPSTLEGYDIEFEVRRGEITQVGFTADKAGIFRYTSTTRLPTMIGQLVVLDTD